MTLTELIAKLRALQATAGDCEVFIRLSCGDIAPLYGVDPIRITGEDLKVPGRLIWHTAHSRTDNDTPAVMVW